MLIAILLLLSSGRASHEQCDIIELNHTQNFSQIILWSYSPDYRRYDSGKWWIVDDNVLTNDCRDSLPMQIGEQWKVNGPSGYTARGRLFRETWTIIDPESRSRKLQGRAH